MHPTSLTLGRHPDTPQHVSTQTRARPRPWPRSSVAACGDNPVTVSVAARGFAPGCGALGVAIRDKASETEPVSDAAWTLRPLHVEPGQGARTLSADTWTHQVSLPAQATSAGKARDFVGAHLGRRCPTDDVAAIQLVTSELATNAIRHAHTPFTVTLRGNLSEVRLMVRDGDPLMGPPASELLMSLGGRGLRIAEELSDAWGVDPEPDGKTVWARFDAATTPTAA